MIRYLDSSALAKAYVLESGSDRVVRWLRTGNVWICRLGIVEVHSALVRKARGGGLTARELREALAGLDSDLRRIPVAELDEPTGALSCRLLRTHSLRGADAIHLATALGLQERLGSVVLVSWDDRMLAAGKAAGLSIDGGNRGTISDIPRA